MTSSTLALLELILVFGGVLGLALWELRSVSGKRRHKEPRPPPGG
jgi:hypothetical protein